MADISFIQRDYKGCQNLIANGFPLTTQTLTNLYGFPSAGINIDYIRTRLTLTSPASWSGGKYWASLRVFFYEDDGDPGNYNTLVSEIDYPVVFWTVGETSTAKTGIVDIPLKLLDKRYKIRVRIVGGDAVSGTGSAGFTFSAINCHLFMYGRTDQ
jgi:hypothetical protein